MFLIDSTLLAYALSWTFGFVLSLVLYLLARYWCERESTPTGARCAQKNDG